MIENHIRNQHRSAVWKLMCMRGCHHQIVLTLHLSDSSLVQCGLSTSKNEEKPNWTTVREDGQHQQEAETAYFWIEIMWWGWFSCITTTSTKQTGRLHPELKDDQRNGSPNSLRAEDEFASRDHQTCKANKTDSYQILGTPNKRPPFDFHAGALHPPGVLGFLR